MTEVANWGAGFRILCVDDDKLNLHLRCKILEGLGCQVSSSCDPIAACCFPVCEYDLIIVDFDMPSFNGRELLLELRRLGACCPIMLLSGGLDDLPRDTRILFTICLAKGQRVAAFLEAIRCLLEGGRVEPCDC